ncbi:MAG: insulinase family protein [Candidatus Eisenbacteria bacterium]|nr:insulinase family protein [Candidatus Eisenbacteria bacterium]
MILRRVPRAVCCRFLGFALLASFAWSTPPASAQSASGSSTPSVAGPAPAAASAAPVRWGYLDNGLGYLVISNRAAPLIGSTAIVHAGSGVEDPKTQGASHFLEHLLFNGTEGMTQEQLYAAFDRMGVYHNATTRPSHMAHFILTPRESFSQALRLQQSMVFHSELSAEKVEKERGIILAELAKDQDSGEQDLERRLLLDQFGPVGYGLPTLGTAQSIAELSRAEIQDFYVRYYAPGNVTWVLIGDLDPDAAVDSLRATVGRETARTAVANSSPSIDFRAPTRRDHYARVEAVTLQWVWDGPPPALPGFHPFRALLEAQIAGSTSALGTAIQAALGDSLVGYMGELAEYPGRSLVRIRVDLTPGTDVEASIRQVESLYRTVAQSRPTEAELGGWRNRQEADEEFLREKPHYYGILRGEALAARELPAMAHCLEEMRRVTGAEVNVMTSPLSLPALRLSVVRPLPSPSPVSDADPSPRTVERMTLRSGVEVIAIQSAESEVFAAHLFVRDRSAREPEGKAGIAELLHLLLEEGPADQSLEQFGRRLDALGAEWKSADDPRIPYDDFYTVPDWSYLRFQTLDRNAEAGLALVAATLRRPRLEDVSFTRARRQMEERAQKASVSSREAGRRLAERVLWGRQSGVFGDAATVGSITPADVADFAPSYLDPRGLMVVVASSLPIDRLRSILESTLGELPARGSAPGLAPANGTFDAARAALLARLETVSKDPDATTARGLDQRIALAAPGAVVVVDSIGVAQASLQYALLPGPAAAANPAAMTVANAILSDRIAFQLREREGLAYSIGSSVVRGPGGAPLWVASAGAAASAIPRLIEGFRAEIERLAAEPPSRDETERTVGKLRGSALMRRSTRLNLAYATGAAALRGEAPGELEARELAWRQVTPEEIQGVIRESLLGQPAVVLAVH